MSLISDFQQISANFGNFGQQFSNSFFPKSSEKKRKFTQAESLLQDTREKLANDLLPGGSTEVQQNK